MSESIAGVPSEPSDVVSPNVGRLNTVQDNITYAEESYNSALEKLIGHIMTPINDAETLIEQSERLCVGCVVKPIDDAEKPIIKATNKIVKKVMTTISDSIGLLTRYGYGPPNEQEIQYAAVTGDYLSQTIPDPEPVGADGMTDTTRALVNAFTGQGSLTDGKTTVGGNTSDTVFELPGSGGTVGGGTGPVMGDPLPPIVGVDDPSSPTTPTLPPATPPTTPQPPYVPPPLGVLSALVLTKFGVPCTSYSAGPFWSKSTRDESHGAVAPSLLEPIGTVGGTPVDGFAAYGANWLSNRTLRDQNAIGTMVVASEPGPYRFVDGNGAVFTASIDDQFNRENIRAVPLASGRLQLVAFLCDPCKPPSYPCVIDGVLAPPDGDTGTPTTPGGTGDGGGPGGPSIPFDDSCKDADGFIPRFDTPQQCREVTKSAIDYTSQLDKFIADLTPSLSPVTVPEASGLYALALNPLLILLAIPIRLMAGIYGNIYRWFTKAVDRALCASGCNYKAMRATVPVAFMFGWLSKFSGGTLGFAHKPWMHFLNSQCPYELPTTDQATGAWLADAIDDDTWECWVKANGHRVEPQKALRDAARGKPNIHEITTLYMRGDISVETWELEMRALGVTSPVDRNRYLELIRAYPGVEDVIRFLVRDVADPEVEKRFGLSKDFEKKWTGILVDYAKAQGIPDSLALNYWKAHWQLPSNTQLFNIEHRFGAHRTDIPEDQRLKPNDVRDTIELNDMLPFWVDKLLAGSFNSLTRVDARRMYKIGALSEDGLKSAMMDIGYSVRNAELLVEWTRRDSLASAGKIAGLPQKKTYVDLYIKGQIDQQEMADELTALGMKPEEILVVLSQSDKARNIRRKKEIIAGVKKLYVVGLLDDDEALSAMTEKGVGATAANQLISDWEVVRQGRQRLPSVAQLCGWATNGWINREDHIKGLMNLRYSRDYAELLSADCWKAFNEKMARLVSAEEKRKVAAEEKQKAKELRLLEKLQKMWRKIGEEIIDENELYAKKIDKIEKWYIDQSQQEPASPPASVT